jgi:hypothetical protein
LSAETESLRSALRSGEVEPASRWPGFFSVWTVARVVTLAVALTAPLNVSSSPKGLCEGFRRETMAMLVEKVIAKDAGKDVPGSFDTSTLDQVLSMDCGGQEISP